MTIEVHTLVRNAEQFIRQVLEQVLPYVDMVRVSIDENTDDNTLSILANIKTDKIKVQTHKNNIPHIDLVNARNSLMEQVTCDWIWIIDDDEYYPTDVIERILPNLDGDACGIKFWLPITKETYLPYKSNRIMSRFYRNTGKLKWINNFGHECIPIDENKVKNFEERYIHLSVLKKWSWRKDFGKKYKYRITEGEYPKLPQDIINLIKNIYEEKMPNM